MKQRTKSSLKKQIVYLGAAILILIIVLYIVIVNIMYNMINSELRLHNETMMNMAVDQIKDTVELPVELINNVNSLINDKNSLEGQIVTDYLVTIQKSYAYFTNIHIIDKDGIFINTAPYNPSMIGDSAIYEPYYIKGEEGEQYWSEIYISTGSGNPTLSISIQNEEYLIVADLDLLSLPITLNQNSKYEEIKNISILDQWGSYIVADDYEKVKARFRFELFDELNLGKEDQFDYYSDKYSVGYKKISNLNWYIVFEFDYSNSYSNINRFTIILFLACGVLGSAMVFYLRSYFNRISGELNYLQNRANAIINNETSQEEYNKELHFKELSCLNDDFTAMMKTIEDRENKIISINYSLEQTVIERTKELEEINAQLEEEIHEREDTEERISKINENLDQQVIERTEQLEFLNAVLERSVKKAEEASEAKTRFLSIMSHEMRTPLNGIIGFLQMMEMTKLTGEQGDMISVMNNSSKILLDLINDILDIEKYSAGKMIFDEEEFNLKQTLEESINYYEILVRNKNLEFSLDILSAMNILVSADKLKIKQLIGNLLSNAIKFTSVGGISLVCNAITRNTDIEINIEVTDTGIGIKEEVKPYLFSPFTQADAGISRVYGGTGLGLTICREIANHYNGRIDYISVYGKGTTFKVKLILPIVETAQLLNQYEVVNHEIQGSGEKMIKIVLVVEDNLVNQKLMSKYLEMSKIEFEVAENGLEGVTKARNKSFDIIFMDCQMPVMDGFEATRLIRKYCGEKIRIIAMTAYASSDDKKLCLDAGMDEVMTKPVDLDALSRILGINRTTNESYLPKDNKALIDKEATSLMEKIGLDYEVCLDLVITYIDQAQKGFRELKEFIHTKDYKKVKNILHQLKGASGTINQERSRQLFEKAEIFLSENRIEEVIHCIDKIKSDQLFDKVD